MLTCATSGKESTYIMESKIDDVIQISHGS